MTGGSTLRRGRWRYGPRRGSRRVVPLGARNRSRRLVPLGPRRRGVRDAAVQHALQGVFEILRDDFDLAHGEITLLQLPIEDPLFDHVGDQLVNLLWRDALQAA